jgi:hypothetical protein
VLVSTSLCHADKHPSSTPLRDEVCRLCNYCVSRLTRRFRESLVFSRARPSTMGITDDTETRERRFRESLRPAASTMGFMDDTETRERRFRESLRPAASPMGFMTPTERRGFLLNLLMTKVRKYHTGMLTSLSNFFTFLLSYFIASTEWRIQENCRGAKISQHYLTEIESFATWECFFTAQCGKCRGRGTGAMRYLFARL